MEKKNQSLMNYLVLNTLYFNDTVCNNIKSLMLCMHEQDKETHKIYGALKKRANAYLRQVSGFFGEKVDFLASFCGEMDSSCDSLVDNLRVAIEQAFRKRDVPNPEFLARIELVRCLSDISVSLIDTYIGYGKSHCPEVYRLRNYQLRDIQRIANNLAIWVQRGIHPKEEEVDLAREENVANAVHTLCSAFSSHELYKTAIDTAKREQKENEHEEENKHSNI